MKVFASILVGAGVSIASAILLLVLLVAGQRDWGPLLNGVISVPLRGVFPEFYILCALIKLPSFLLLFMFQLKFIAYAVWVWWSGRKVNLRFAWVAVLGFHSALIVVSLVV